jgi:hypothetical protein
MEERASRKPQSGSGVQGCIMFSFLFFLFFAKLLQLPPVSLWPRTTNLLDTEGTNSDNFYMRSARVRIVNHCHQNYGLRLTISIKERADSLDQGIELAICIVALSNLSFSFVF